MLIVAGGNADPNINCLLRRLANRSEGYLVLCTNASSPRMTWTLSDDRLMIDGVEVNAEALFLRYDVFTYLRDRQVESQQRAARWYHAILAWALAHDNVAFLNRRYGAQQTSKPYVLTLARSLGLSVPASIVTNAAMALTGTDVDQWIVKPVDGGEYTRILDEAVADEDWVRRNGAVPMIVQRRLVAPDLRVYRIGERWFGFKLLSAAVDYRTAAGVSIMPLRPTPDIVDPLSRLMDRLGLDFGAADFKTCPETGRLLFLEVNPAPMFSAFDGVADGALADAILDWLLDGARTSGRMIPPTHG